MFEIEKKIFSSTEWRNPSKIKVYTHLFQLSCEELYFKRFLC